MKNSIYLMAIFFLFLSCSNDEDLQPMELRVPSVMNVFCQQSPDVSIRKVEYKYNNDNLMTETTLHNGDIYSQTSYTYNSDNHMTFEIYQTDGLKLEKTFIYNKSGQLVNIKYKTTYYDPDGQVVNESETEAPREYKNGQLIKEWESWGGFNTYEYKEGNVAMKIDHSKLGEKHHVTSYKYSGRLLLEERTENKDGDLIYRKIYQYDAQNRLVVVREGENVIEENEYVGNQLIKKRTYYFGIDPGYDICYGNYIYHYQY